CQLPLSGGRERPPLGRSMGGRAMRFRTLTQQLRETISDTLTFWQHQWATKSRVEWAIKHNRDLFPGEYDFITKVWSPYTRGHGYPLDQLITTARQELDYGATHAAIALLGLFYYARSLGRFAAPETELEAAKLVIALQRLEIAPAPVWAYDLP